LAERYVWEPIIENQAKLWYVGGENGDYLRLRNCLGDRFVHLAHTFEAAIDKIIGDLGNISNK